MTTRKKLLNNLLDIGGVATLNNLYSRTANSYKGSLVCIGSCSKIMLAHQNFGQIPDRILDTIIGNADTLISFACGDVEAVRLAKILSVSPRG